MTLIRFCLLVGLFASSTPAKAVGDVYVAVTPQLTSAMQKILSTLGVTGGAITAPADQYITDNAGNRYVILGSDGIARPLGTPKQSLNQLTASPNIPNPSGECPVISPTTPPAANRVMLDELGYVTPARDQGTRNTCSFFASTAALESAYLLQRGITSDQYAAANGGQPLQLSVEYLAAIVTSSQGLSTAAGDAQNLQLLSPKCNAVPVYGLPLESVWPYADPRAVEQLEMQSVPGAPSDSVDLATLLDVPPGAQVDGGTGLVDVSGYSPDLTSSNHLLFQLNVDLSNYAWSPLPSSTLSVDSTAAAPGSSLYSNQMIFPPQSVHEQAVFAPRYFKTINQPPASKVPACGGKNLSQYFPVVPGAPSPSKACYAALAAPLETVLSQNHAIVIELDIGQFVAGPAPAAGQTITYTYQNPTGAPISIDHQVLLVGYDRTKQLFRIKNSWGPGWGTNGFADLDYAGILAMTEDSVVSFIDGAYGPSTGLGVPYMTSSAPAPIPNLMWRGFWQASIGNTQGVAVIRSLNFPLTGVPDGTFYGNDGTQTQFSFLYWDQASAKQTQTAAGTYTAYFNTYDLQSKAAPTLLFSLTLNQGSTNPIATAGPASNYPSNSPASRWSKCNLAGITAVTAQGNAAPKNYLEVANDPYIFPPCQSSFPWHAAPATWNCPNGGQYQAEFHTGAGTPNNNFYANACVTSSSSSYPAVAVCPQNYSITPNGNDCILTTIPGGVNSVGGGLGGSDGGDSGGGGGAACVGAGCCPGTWDIAKGACAGTSGKTITNDKTDTP